MVQDVKELEAFKMSYSLAMEIFSHTHSFPPEERYALTSQIRRSSRSVSLNLKEAWAKRRYEAHVISKLTDCDGENSETATSIDFARDCGYLTSDEASKLLDTNRQIGRLLGSMLNNPSRWTLKP
ncbi:MAG: four helix bundle protein [Verrucomicrobiae bacterium]|nr:four helix bundle protein [Verrucomicrobiae bacterium]NNJ87007.1 four helix bundle protein [Akkermansiaceae bacterium]